MALLLSLSLQLLIGSSDGLCLSMSIKDVMCVCTMVFYSSEHGTNPWHTAIVSGLIPTVAKFWCYKALWTKTSTQMTRVFKGKV